MTATTLATNPDTTEWRNGITVFAREIIPGDHMMDRGVVREVASLSVVAGIDNASLVHFEPLAGYPPTIRVANRVQVYVRRSCPGEHAPAPMPVIDDEARSLFAAANRRRADPLADPLLGARCDG